MKAIETITKSMAEACVAVLAVLTVKAEHITLLLLVQLVDTRECAGSEVALEQYR